MHVRNDDQPYSSATNAIKAWPETAEVFSALSHGPGRLRPAVTGRSRPIMTIHARCSDLNRIYSTSEGLNAEELTSPKSIKCLAASKCALIRPGFCDAIRSSGSFINK